MTQHDDEITNLQKRNDSDYTDRASERLRALRPITVEDFDRVAALNARGSDAFELLNRNAAEARSMGLVPMYHAKGVNEAEGMFATSRSSRFLTSASGQMSEALVSYVTKEQRAQAWQHAQQDPGSAGQKGTFYFPKSMNVQWALAGTPPSQVPQSSLENALSATGGMRTGAQAPTPMQERLSSELNPSGIVAPGRIAMAQEAAQREDGLRSMQSGGAANRGNQANTPPGTSEIRTTPETAQERFNNSVRSGWSSLQHLTGLPTDANSPVMGTGAFGWDKNAGQAVAAFGDPFGSQGLRLGSGDINYARNMVASRYGAAVEQFGGMTDPTARAVNISKATYGAVRQMQQGMDAETRGLEGRGSSPEVVQASREVGQAMVVATKKMALAATEAITEGASRQAVQELSTTSRRISPKTFDDMLAGKGVSPEDAAAINQQVAQAGGRAMVGRTGITAVLGGKGGVPQSSVELPPADGGGYGTGGAGDGTGGRGQGVWGGGLGSLLYGAYIAKRFWGYTGQPVMQATEEYAKQQGELEPMLTGEIPRSGAGALYGRRERGKYMLGAAGYDLFGGALGFGAEAMNNPAVAQMAAGTGVFAGAGIGLNVLGRSIGKSFGTGDFMFGMSGNAVGGALRSAGAIAAGVGVAYTALSAGAEYYNQLAPGKDADWWEMPAIGAQSAGRLLMGPGLSLLAALSDTRGTGVVGEAARGYLGALTGTKAWEYFNKDIAAPSSTEAAAATGGLATAAQISQYSEKLGIATENLPDILKTTYGISGKRGVEGATGALAQAISKMVTTEGMTAASAGSAVGGYAELLGYMPGETGAVQAATSYAGMTVEERSQATRGATRRAGFAGIARQYVSSEDISESTLRSMMGGYSTQVHGGVGAQVGGQLINAGVSPLMGTMSGINLMQGVQAGRYTTNQAQFAGSMMGNITSAFGAGATNGLMTGGSQGFGSNVLMNAMATLSPAQQAGVGAIWSGDIQGMSTAARTGNLGGWAQFNDRSGRPMYMSDIGASMDQGRMFDQEWGTNYTGLAGQYLDPGTSPNMAAASGMEIWGTGSTATASGKLQASMTGSGFGMTLSAGMRDVIDNGYRGLTGMNAVQLKASDQQFGAQMAQGALQLKGVEARQEMLWGGGSWDRPSAGSLWGLEDRQRGIQWGSTQQDWTAQRQRSAMGQAYSVAGEGIQQERMTASRGYQQYQFGYERSGQLLQRQWTQQDNQYEDTMRGLQFGWGMEDVNEQIRFSTGRQRRNLVKQRGRMVTQGNLEEEQVDRTREREQQSWAREDEQFQKRVEYFEKTTELEDKQFELQVKHREETFAFETKEFERHVKEQQELHKINEEIIKVNRKFQAEEMERQKEGIKLSMAAAAAAKAASDAMLFLNEQREKEVGTMQTLSAQEKAIAIAKAVTSMAVQMNNTDLAKIREWIRFIEKGRF